MNCLQTNSGGKTELCPTTCLLLPLFLALHVKHIYYATQILNRKHTLHKQPRMLYCSLQQCHSNVSSRELETNQQPRGQRRFHRNPAPALILQRKKNEMNMAAKLFKTLTSSEGMKSTTINDLLHYEA